MRGREYRVVSIYIFLRTLFFCSYERMFEKFYMRSRECQFIGSMVLKISFWSNCAITIFSNLPKFTKPSRNFQNVASVFTIATAQIVVGGQDILKCSWKNSIIHLVQKIKYYVKSDVITICPVVKKCRQKFFFTVTHIFDFLFWRIDFLNKKSTSSI